MRSRKWERCKYFITASSKTAPMIIPAVSSSHGLVAIPNTVPAAGGCSVSVMAMTSINKPTDTAKLRFRTGDKSSRNVSTGEANNSTAESRPQQ